MYVPCVDFETFAANWKDYKIFDGQTGDIVSNDKNVYLDNTNETPIVVSGQPTMSVCYEGRAVRCLPKEKAAGGDANDFKKAKFTTGSTDSYGKLYCVDESGAGATNATFKPNKKVADSDPNNDTDHSNAVW